MDRERPIDVTSLPLADAAEQAGIAEAGRGFEVVVRDHASAMYRVALAIVRDPALAEDVVQESMFRAWRSISTYRGEAPMRNWLLRITHNTAVSVLRRSREDPWDPQRLPPRAVDGPDYRTVWIEELEEVRAALGVLDELSRSILALRITEDMSYEQIAQTLGITLGQVKIRLLRARRTLAAATGRGTP